MINVLSTLEVPLWQNQAERDLNFGHDANLDFAPLFRVDAVRNVVGGKVVEKLRREIWWRYDKRAGRLGALEQ